MELKGTYEPGTIENVPRVTVIDSGERLVEKTAERLLATAEHAELPSRPRSNTRW
ncbi:hypothetical protein [Streptomyces rubiginosohelvolus]|uniref:hypothetical protein n=1 Tax=Streptomyces rubiginosohelvolus TaxID=67362 RepID=UPI0037238A7E